MSRLSLMFSGILLAAAVPALLAQDPGRAATPPATVPFVNKAFGFELQVPAGWSYDRTGFFGPGGSLGLLRGASPDGRKTLQILVFRQLELASFPEWIDFFGQQLSRISGTKRVQVQGQTGVERPAAYVVAEAQLGLDHTRALYYCVQFDEETVWVLSQASAIRTLENGAEEREGDSGREVHVPDEFTRLTQTLRVFYDPAMARLMVAALQRGKDYLARYQLQEDIRELRIDESVRYYQILVAGKPIGYLTRQFTREEEPLQRPGRSSSAKEGLRVRERSYRFANDGTVHFSKVDLFSSRDLETDLYELWTAEIPRSETDAPVFITRDQCVRERETLFSTYTTSRDETYPEPRRPLKLDATFLGLGWTRLLPALLGAERREAVGFTVYDSETRTLITHVIRSLGERPLPGAGEAQAHAFETWAGFVERPGVVYTDADGNMLRYEVGQLVLRLSSEAAIERDFGPRRDAANLRLKEHQQRP